MRDSVGLLVKIKTPETYEELTKFLNRLLTEEPEHKDLFLTWTVFSLAYIGNGLNNGDSISILKEAIPYLDVKIQDEQVLKDLAEHFYRFNELEGIKEILNHCTADGIPDLETRCLELLKKHDPEFVEKRKAQKESTNTETEESS